MVERSPIGVRGLDPLSDPAVNELKHKMLVTLIVHVKMAAD